MFKLLGLGWIIGIALMGVEIPFLNHYGGYIFFLGLFAYVFLNFKHELFTERQFFKGLLVIFAVSAALSMGYDYGKSQLQERLMQREQDVQAATVIVYVSKLGTRKDRVVRQPVEILGRGGSERYWVASIKAPLHELSAPQPLKLGHYYSLSGRVKPAHSYAVPGVFDQEKWFIQQNLMASFKVEHAQMLTEADIYRLGFWKHVQQKKRFWHQLTLSVEELRLAYRNTIENSYLQNKGLLLALLTGDESLLNQETEDLFQRLGISHLLAISGPHVLIFASLMSWLIMLCLNRYWPDIYLIYPRQKLLLIPFLCGVAFYTAFAGFEIPALRTLLTIVLIALFIALGRRLSSFTILIYSASILLFFDPFSILSAAFWLSYGACFILLRVYQTLEKYPVQTNGTYFEQVYRYLQVLILSQWKIFLALLPLVLWFFREISLIAPIANMVAIPLLSIVIVPLNIMAALLWYFVEPVGILLFSLCDYLLSLCIWLFKILEDIPVPSIHLYGDLWHFFLLLVGVFILFLPRVVVPRFWGILCLTTVLLGLGSSPITRLSIIDVGQGQAIFLQQRDVTLLIDTGGYYDENIFSIGEKVMAPFLQQQGVKTLDRVLLTHLDQDHSGALASLQKQFYIEEVISNQRPEILKKEKFSYCHQGQKWSYPHLSIEILAPLVDDLPYVAMNQNELSCVIYLRFLEAGQIQHVLIMGDAGWKTEYQILKDYPHLPVDVLVLGHHGSKHSSAYAFLSHYQPKLAIASAGFNNIYQHPSQSTQRRLSDLAIPLLSTSTSGTLTFKWKNGRVQLQQYRHAKPWLYRQTAVHFGESD